MINLGSIWCWDVNPKIHQSYSLDQSSRPNGFNVSIHFRSPGTYSIKHFLCNLRPNGCKLWNGVSFDLPKLSKWKTGWKLNYFEDVHLRIKFIVFFHVLFYLLSKLFAIFRRHLLFSLESYGGIFHIKATYHAEMH